MKFTFCFTFSILVLGNSFSQGCSDAGFCTIGNIQSSSKDSLEENKNAISLLLTNGIGDQNVYVFTPGFQYERGINSHFSIQTKITGNYAVGNLGSATGLGDLFLASTYVLNEKKKFQHSFTLGTKIPLNLGDIRYNNQPLPMQYQSSLGTLDLIVGYKLNFKKWSANVAYQQPITGRNRNTFLPQYINTQAAFKYPPSNDFNRKGDALVRIAYQLISSKKWKWNASVLSIYHLGEDTYIDGNISNSPLKIEGSEGLTVNITSNFSYKINESMSLALGGGVPLIVRKVRPDGLTRSFSLTPELIIHF
jgi:hypothetical protein